jgi:hypothetical protein
MKKITLTTIFVVVILLTVTPSFADNPPGFNKMGILYLFEKTPLQNTGQPVGPWPIVPNGAWGSMSYNLWGPKFDFLFHGRRLVPGGQYTLIYYPDPWPGEDLICLGSGMANGGGNLLIKGRQAIGTNLPAKYDANWTPCGKGDPAACLSGAVGAKIWLVLSSDADCEGDKDEQIPPQMTSWNPTEYLFEYNLINFQFVPGQGNDKGPKK